MRALILTIVILVLSSVCSGNGHAVTFTIQQLTNNQIYLTFGRQFTMVKLHGQAIMEGIFFTGTEVKLLS